METPRRRGRPRKEDAGDTKNLLLDAAIDLFSRNGFAGTSIRAIAREVGLSESVLYAHFANKQAIFEAALGRMGPQGATAMVEALDSGLPDDPRAFLRGVIGYLVEAWTTPDALKFMSFMAQDGLSHHPALVAGIKETNRHLAGIFARWIDEGRLPATLGDPGSLAFAALAPIGMCRVLWFNADTPADELEAAKQRALAHATTFTNTLFGPPEDSTTA
ncbi:hypothetical protein GCM10027589_38850 [Actinocorallia lasiicapitis]